MLTEEREVAVAGSGGEKKQRQREVEGVASGQDKGGGICLNTLMLMMRW